MLNNAYAQGTGFVADSRGKEAMLVKCIMPISNFQVAQLARGDLLLARVRPRTTLGDAPNAPRDRMEDVRDEARGRLQRFQKQSSATLFP